MAKFKEFKETKLSGIQVYAVQKRKFMLQVSHPPKNTWAATNVINSTYNIRYKLACKSKYLVYLMQYAFAISIIKGGQKHSSISD